MYATLMHLFSFSVTLIQTKSLRQFLNITGYLFYLSHFYDLIWGTDDILDSKWEQRIVSFEKQNNRHLRLHVLKQRSYFYASLSGF